MPKPTNGESKDDFMKRCMDQLVGQENHDPRQAYAECNGIWEEHKSE